MSERKFVGTIKIGRKTYLMTLRGYIVIGTAGTVSILAGLYVLETIIYLLGGR